MKTYPPTFIVCGTLWALLTGAIARGQEPVGALEIKSIAEVESRVAQPQGAPGSSGVELVPADRVAPGDRVIYTLEVRNGGKTPIDAPDFTYPIPEHMRFVANSAVGPGAEVSYSVDGGRSYARPEALEVKGPDGKLRAAVAADYTDIRWRLKNSLKVNSVAFVRFRTIVK
ncbi:MAG: hypothetical protein WBF89_12970 [Steroidobacteraceae bacterium]